MSNDCLGTDEILKCLLVISCVLGPRSSVCHHQFLIAICSDGHWLSFHREPDDAPSVACKVLFILGPRDMKHWAKVSKITQGIYDEYERKEEALRESRYWEMVEEGWFSD